HVSQRTVQATLTQRLRQFETLHGQCTTILRQLSSGALRQERLVARVQQQTRTASFAISPALASTRADGWTSHCSSAPPTPWRTTASRRQHSNGSSPRLKE